MRYLNALRNQWLAARGWMFATLVFAALAAWLALTLGRAVGDLPTRLVPYDFHTLEGPVEVGSDGRSSEAYLSRIALSDLQLYTDWTPATVASQYARFQNRLTPALYARVGSDLNDAASELADSERSQALFISGTAASDDRVRGHGVLRIWHGSELAEEREKRYELRYRFSGGMPWLAGFRTEEL